MNTIVFSCQDHDVPIKWKVNPRAKRLSLRYTPQEKAFILTTPSRTTEGHIQTFLGQCRPWMEKNLKKMFHVKQFVPGEEIRLHGEPFQCLIDPLRRQPVLCHRTQTLRLPSRCPPSLLYDFLKKMAMETLTPYVHQAVQDLGHEKVKVTFRDTRTRWGSCSARKTISLNWRLILAPPAVAQYVCIHEAVHLRHMNHSQAFWQMVRSLCPEYLAHKKWLKTQGYSLLQV